jgi:hypothetical protein
MYVYMSSWAQAIRIKGYEVGSGTTGSTITTREGGRRQQQQQQQQQQQRK